MPKFISVALTVFMVLYLIFAPIMFFPHIRDNLYTIKEENKEEEYRGIMTLWNISDNTVYSSSFIASCIENLENTKTRVYIEKENLSPDEAQKRFEAGEFPDMICFSGVSPLAADKLAPLNKCEYLLESVKETGDIDGITYALPFICAVNITEDEMTADPVVFYYSAINSEDTLKNKMCRDFANILVSEKMQKTLADSDKAPVTDYEDMYETENDLTAVYDALAGELVFKNVFE